MKLLSLRNDDSTARRFSRSPTEMRRRAMEPEDWKNISVYSRRQWLSGSEWKWYCKMSTPPIWHEYMYNWLKKTSRKPSLRCMGSILFVFESHLCHRKELEGTIIVWKTQQSRLFYTCDMNACNYAVTTVCVKNLYSQ